MSSGWKKTLLVLTDLVTIHTAFFLWCRLRISFGFYAPRTFNEVLVLSLFVFIFWFILFIFFGHYRTYFTRSRTDEFIAVVKSVTAGIFLIFLVTFDLDRDFAQPVSLSRIMIISYWFMMIFLVGSGRILLRTVHRTLLVKGIGRRKTVIVGWGKKARDLHDRVVDAPALGYDIIGFIATGEVKQPAVHQGVPVLGSLENMNHILLDSQVQEVIVAVPHRSERMLQTIIGQCDGTPAGIKIVPDLYDVIIGQVRTNQIYGFPLIEILPQLMTPWEAVVKRAVDILFSAVLIIGFLPVWLLVALIIRMDSRGPIFYAQQRVGRDGKVFRMFKFRSMVQDAEKNTGPVWATNNDPRVTRVGKWLRKLRIDEVPQLINILDGDMSLVGPRPERPFFVETFKQTIPLYSRRLRIQPGVTGWAQVKGDYDQSLDDVKKKLKYDLFYLENMSLRMDLKILLNTVYVMLRGKGQ